MMPGRHTPFPEVLPNQCLSAHASCQHEPDLEHASASEQPQYYAQQVSAKLDAQLMSPGLDAYAKQCAMPENPMCRICHDSGAQEELLSPCECSGTLATIHRTCLEHWLSASGTSFCELCHYQFTVQKKSRSLLEWLQNPSLRQEKRTLFGDMVCFLLITPLATVSGWLCLRGAIDHLHFSSRLEAVGLIALTVALFTIYLFWTLVSLRYHCRLYNEWRQSNQRVVLLLPRSHSDVSALHSSQGRQRGKQPSKESIVADVTRVNGHRSKKHFILKLIADTAKDLPHLEAKITVC